MSETEIAAPDAAEMLARARVRRLNVVRLAGVGLALVGAAIMAGKVDLPRLVGVLILLGGMYYGLLFPTLLVRRWKRAERKQEQRP